MALKRGRDEKDLVKDLHDRARNIVAQGKEVPRLYNSQSQMRLSDSSVPFQFPLKNIGLSEKDLAYYSRREEQKRSNLSPFFDNPVLPNQTDNQTKASIYFNNKLLFS